MHVVKILIGLNIAWFVAMVCGSSLKSILLPSSQVLLNWGASSASETLAAHQFWRLVTCSFVHVGIFHLGINMYVLRDIGREVEAAFGRLNFCIVYLYAAIGGALTSILVNPLLVSAGASGAIFGVFGAMLAIVWRRPAMFPKGYLILHGKIVLCLILYTIIFSFIDKNADNAAHFGGFVMGFIAGLCALPSADKTGKRHLKQVAATALLAVPMIGATYLSYAALAHKPEILAETHYRKAVDLLQDEKYRESLPLLDQALALNPNNSNAYCDRARAYSEIKEYDKAISDADSAIKISETNKTAHTVRANVLQKLGKYKQATDELSKVIGLDPKDAMAYNNRAWSEEAAGLLDQSISDCDQSIRLKNDLATTYDTRAMAYILQNKFEQAINDLDHAIKIKSTDGAFYYHRAIARSKSGVATVSDDIAAAKKFGYTPEKWEPPLPD
ncbi:MAG: rhomboid family intramembrane serine protease [Candidatus Melainabacteria bacterium]|nr:rhomboid family intramembrane serine protease [Candidatus Melainabacteria bacterium]